MEKKHLKKRSGKTNSSLGKKIVVIGIITGTVIGFCFWRFVTRCPDTECFFHYSPLSEMVVGGFAGWVLPSTFLNIKNFRS